tara:strand:+ start:499 stop:777 length:279 start_codon:yes stop_codon:yes gene_type:complete
MNNNNIKGDKHICSNCGQKFFDLNKRPIVCPKCNTEVLDKSFVRAKHIISDTKVDENTKDILLSEDKNIINDQNTQNDLDDDDETSAIVNID